ncbi:uncharacterized protein A4U43_C03F16370 [Asparagus officinalis]|uniref:Alpha-1,3-mannosyl-glycoprotein 2-beta-N-acetylglucosaminyltransferase n=1 Tax=Asparagus officinalis TaxID=4686 RepID=A0A5P1FFI2_ASPOF|nr:uncharacterized protein A4U43_C03F16370 [Asparagus officinalis]
METQESSILDDLTPSQNSTTRIAASRSLENSKVDRKSIDLTYLMEDKYLSYFAKFVSDAKRAYGADAVLKAFNIDGDVRIQYNDQADFERIARQFGVFEEWN